jgi:hypothetical protein
MMKKEERKGRGGGGVHSLQYSNGVGANRRQMALGDGYNHHPVFFFFFATIFTYLTLFWRARYDLLRVVSNCLVLLRNQAARL